MKNFLDDTAISILNEYGNDIAQLCLVFPSRRAGLYFTLALRKCGYCAPVNYTTIDALMQKFSTLKKADNLFVLSALHRIYSKYHTQEAFDKFYSFGKLLLSDFDSVDKYMVDASDLYSIVSDTLDVENQFRDDTHQKAVEFWAKFNKNKVELYKEQSFIRIWQSLYNIYAELRNLLASAGVGYSGMIYRNAAENIDHWAMDSEPRYVIVGLNAISSSEEVVLKALKNSNKADFIWDFNPDWLNDQNNEAVWFIRSNIVMFPQADYFTRSAKNEPPQIEIIATQSEILQCKVVDKVLNNISLESGNKQLDEKTAIVLTDENLLVPLLYSLPDCANEINISIGYPISSTPAYVFLERLIALQTTRNSDGNFYHKAVSLILEHQFIDNQIFARELEESGCLFFPSSTLSEGGSIENLFVPIGKTYLDLHYYLIRVIDQLISKIDVIGERDIYALKLIYRAVMELCNTIIDCKIEVSQKIYISLLFEKIGAVKLPYDGRSGRGVQIMGILESRTLNFDNIILLSMNDDNFPNSKTASSYIPQNLRVAYGLPSAKEHSAIWSYYFYRLVDGAKKVTLLYCNSNRADSSGEASRYIYQLKYNTKCSIKEASTRLNVGSEGVDNSIFIAKNDNIINDIRARNLSPSAINRYVNCPLSFYFNDIARLKEDQKVENEISSLDIGNALHLSMQKLYANVVKIEDARPYIKAISRAKIQAVIAESMGEICGSKADILAPDIALAEVAILRMIENIVKYDGAQDEPFSIEALEEEITCTIGSVNIKGTIDRIDKLVDNTMRIVDYKSGGDKTDFSSIDAVLNGEQSEHRSAVAQILIYSIAAAKKFNRPVTPALYVARSMGQAKFTNPILLMNKTLLDPIPSDVFAEIEYGIKEKLNEIVDVTIGFNQSENKPKSCKYCIYSTICQVKS
ncbi:MAG: PD-(D/E)XK nuclease family protein [Mucinivorans sp.]